MKINRTKNTKRNIVAGLINKFFLLLLPFVVRTVFIYSLGSEYLGLNSLFTSILTVMNVVELGFSSAIVYSMYEPVAKDDFDTVCSLLNFYKTVYRAIGIVILVIGIVIMPFLPHLIKGTCPSELNLYVLFAMYLLNTCLSYLLYAYKKSVLEVLQRRDIIEINNLITVGLTNILQLILLIAWKNPHAYYIYLIIMILFTVVNNILNAKIVDKKYPQFVCRGQLSGEIKSSIKKQVSGLMITRLCQMTRTSFDSIFISAFIGLTMATVYGNYYLIIQTLVGIMNIFTNSMLAGVGNSVVAESKEKNYSDFNTLNFIYMWISGWSAITLFILYQNFMKIWVGDELMLSLLGSLLFSLYYYSLKIGDIRAMFSDAIGLWWENRIRAVLEIITNIVLNYILVKKFGVYGIVGATIIPMVGINFTGGAHVLYRYYFKDRQISKYFLDNLLYFIATIFGAFVTWVVSEYMGQYNLLGLVKRGMICCILPNIVYFVVYFKTSNYSMAKKWILRRLGSNKM